MRLRSLELLLLVAGWPLVTRACNSLESTVTWRTAACYKIGGEHKDAWNSAHALCLLLSPFAAWAPVCEARLLVGVAEAAGVRRTARRDAALARVGGIAADHALEAARARRAGAVRSRGARNLGLARSPATIRWRFHRSPRCTAASALLQPLSSPSALGRRRARSRRASPASLRWRFHRCARCTGLQVLCRSRCLRRRLWWAVAVLARRERCQLRYAGASTAVRGAGLRVLCRSRCPRRRL